MPGYPVWQQLVDQGVWGTGFTDGCIGLPLLGPTAELGAHNLQFGTHCFGIRTGLWFMSGCDAGLFECVVSGWHVLPDAFIGNRVQPGWYAAR